jgi:hypothetical protein
MRNDNSRIRAIDWATTTMRSQRVDIQSAREGRGRMEKVLESQRNTGNVAFRSLKQHGQVRKNDAVQ